MKKLRLDLEELTVESFPTASTDDERGTVRAHAEYGTVQPPSCPTPCETYDDTFCGLTWHCTVADQC